MSSKEWQDVKKTLSDMIPNYDNINKRITFGLDEKWRNTAAKESKNTGTALEIGSGTGTLAVRLFSNKVICLDPIPEMHKAFKKRLEESAVQEKFKNKFEFLVGSGEAIPLPDNHVDIVYCAFSFRDFHDKKKGLSEMYRVLKKDGKLVILDIGKSGKVRNKLIYFYIKNIAPIIAGEGKEQMRCLAETYKAFGTPKHYSKIAENTGFKKVNTKFLTLGLAFILIAKK